MREAQIRFDDSDFETMGVTELLTVCREADPLGYSILECDGVGAVVQLDVTTQLDESRLDALSYVDSWDRPTDHRDRYRYVIEFTAPNLSQHDALSDVLISATPDHTSGGVTVSLVGTQSAIRSTIESYRQAGLRPTLQKFGTYHGRRTPLQTLTERQRLVLQTAYENGFYDIPRQASTADVADHLDIDASTVSEHLQRAERNLLTTHLSP